MKVSCILESKALWCGVNRKSNITAAPHDTVFDIVSQLLAGLHVAAEQVVVHLSHISRFVKDSGKPGCLSRGEVHLSGKAQEFLFTKKHSESHWG